jgi:hypothetical protein
MATFQDQVAPRMRIAIARTSPVRFERYGTTRGGFIGDFQWPT